MTTEVRRITSKPFNTNYFRSNVLGKISRKTSRAIEYALRLGVGSVIRRLGYLLELYRLAPQSELQRLRSALTVTYSLLDPVMPTEGPRVAKWRLRLNVAPEELEAIRST